MTLGQATALAVVLYLVPVLGLFGARARREQARWEIGLGIPLAVAADLLLILACARAVRLESAIFFARGLWLAGAGGVVLWRRRRGARPGGALAWPASLDGPALVALAAGTLVGVLVGRLDVQPWFGTDGSWHVPLTTSLLGQTVPFANVYQPGQPLAYPFAGNLVAAAIKALSLGAMHSAVALAAMRGVLFGLCGATLALLLGGQGQRRSLWAGLSVIVLLFAGPFVVRQTGEALAGRNFATFMRASFRPGTCFSALLLLGFVAPLWLRLRLALSARAGRASSAETRPVVSVWRTAPVLVAGAAVFTLTDEASIGMLGLALGAAWIFEPQILAPTRRQGLVVLAALLVAVVAPTLLFPGALGAGTPRDHLSLIPWRAPGYLNPSAPLTDPAGLGSLALDTAPMLGVGLGGLWLWLRLRDRALAAGLLFYGVLFGLGLFGLCGLDLDHRPMESHRFMTAPMLVAQLAGAVWLALALGVRRGPERAAAADPPWPGLPGLRWLARRAWNALPAPALVLGVALSLAVVSTMRWLPHGERYLTSHHSLGTPRDFFGFDCRTELGAGLGEELRPHYSEKSLFYLYTGCHPVWASAPARADSVTKAHVAQWGAPALRDLNDNMLAEDEALVVSCWPSAGRNPDPICAAARQLGRCQPLGQIASACTLSPAERQQVLDELGSGASATH